MSESNSSHSPRHFPLCQLPAGGLGRVQALTGDVQFCQRIREMGFGESALITKVSGTQTILCQVNGTRIALSHGAARNIVVQQVAENG
jgi:ferrous iron transport protein A